MNRYLLLMVIAFCTAACFAQADRQYIRSGNKYFHKQDYVKAEAEYRKAVAMNPNNPQALYNLGCALTMQQQDSAAIETYQKAGLKETSKSRKAMAYHNIGVICQNHQLYNEAIEAYKESLRNNPSNDETRYNLALCQKMKKDDNNQDNQDNKDQQQQQQNNDSNQDKQENKDQQQDNKDQQQQDNQMSKENAEQLINAAMQDEKDTQQRVKDAMQQMRPRRLDKNW